MTTLQVLLLIGIFITGYILSFLHGAKISQDKSKKYIESCDNLIDGLFKIIESKDPHNMDLAKYYDRPNKDKKLKK